MRTITYIFALFLSLHFSVILTSQTAINLNGTGNFTHGVVISTTNSVDTIYELPTTFLNIKPSANQINKSYSDLSCETEDPAFIIPPKRTSHKNTTTPLLNIYYELDYATYVSLGSDINTCIVWLNHQFTQVAEIYTMHNIDLQVSEIFIWDAPDIYAGNNIVQRLSLFGARLQNDFNGDAAQLLTTTSIGGGRAHIDQLCKTYDPITHKGPYSVLASLVPYTDTSQEVFWNVYGMAHELGHTVGSPHTHACLWGPNNDRPIDNCFILEGGCDNTEDDYEGTVMSYCHFNIGTDLDNGFGSEVGTFLRDKLLSNPCTNGECPKNKTVISVSSDTPTEKAFQSITSTAQIPVGSSHVFSASETVIFQPGFEVATQATFATMLDGCLTE